MGGKHSLQIGVLFKVHMCMELSQIAMLLLHFKYMNTKIVDLA